MENIALELMEKKENNYGRTFGSPPEEFINFVFNITGGISGKLHFCNISLTSKTVDFYLIKIYCLCLHVVLKWSYFI